MSAIGAGRPAAALERRLHGPSAFGAGFRRTWQIVRLNAIADFQQRYAGNTLGYVWTLLKPITLFGILYVVITEVFGRFTTIPDYGSLLLLNIMLFTFFSEAIAGSLRSLATGGLIRKAELPVIAMPFATILSSGLTLFANLIVVITWILIAGVTPNWGWLLLPVVVAALVILTAGTSLLLSAWWVGHRDVAQIWPAISRLLFYATPILFPLEVVPDGFLKDLQSVNPLAPIVAEARVWIIDPAAPGWFDDRGLLAASLPIALIAVIAVAGVVVFSRRARTAAEDI